ncbi:MAG TPA: nickel pincer cofactor biosynthesis protein LarC [Acidisarcina sp.]
MRVGYLECFSGVSGDMMLGALIDAGVPRELLERTARALNVGADLRFSRVDRSGISASKVDVIVGDATKSNHVHTHTHTHADSATHTHSHHEHHHAHEHEAEHSAHAHSHQHEHEQPGEHLHGRGLVEIRALIDEAGLDPGAAAVARRAFELLAASESKIHNVPEESIHFHEVGAVDAIVDIVCSAVGLCSLGVDEWVCSPLNVGGGFVDCAHGKFPVPAPATADLLRGAPTYSSGIAMELVTPTGAALIRALGCEFGDAPAMRVANIGYGAGSRDPKRFPNVLRLSIGEHITARQAGVLEAGSFQSETIAVLECAVDDLNPQVLANFAQLALERGALDIMSASVVMKKGRLGTHVTVLCRPAQAAEFQELMFRETSTLGVRIRREERVFLDRAIEQVETQYGRVRVKVGSWDGERIHAQPEFEDCRRLALEAGVPVKLVIEATMLAYSDSESLKGSRA